MPDSEIKSIRIKEIIKLFGWFILIIPTLVGFLYIAGFFIIFIFSSVSIGFGIFCQNTPNILCETPFISFLVSVVIFTLSTSILIGIIYFMLRLYYLFGTRKVITLKNETGAEFEKTINVNISVIYFQYKLQVHYWSLKQIFGEMNPEIFQYYRSIDPEFEFIPWWKPFHRYKNFQNFLRFISKYSLEDLVELYKKTPLFMEGLHLSIQNINTGKTETVPLQPTDMIGFTSRPFYKFDENNAPEGFFIGDKFKVNLKYRGEKGYNFTMWVK